MSIRSKKTFKLRPWLWRWHRRIGLAASLLVLLLSVTGIQLNHIDVLNWDKKPLKSAWLLSLYGVESASITSYQVDANWLSSLGDGRVYWNEQLLSECEGDFVGALNYQGRVLVACSELLILVTESGDVIERLGSVYQLPRPLEALGFCGETLCFQAMGVVHQVDIERLRWPKYLLQAPFEPALSMPLPTGRRKSLLADYYSGGITWERVLLDLHSGRLLGMGPWLMDIVALLLILLALSGLLLWGQGRNRQGRNKPRK